MVDLRQRAEEFIRHPFVEMGLVGLIVLSVVLVLLEPLVPEASTSREVLVITSDALTGVFVVELLIRFLVAHKKRRFFQRYWLDIIAVMPMARPLRFFRVLRLLRLFRAGILFNRRLSVFQQTFRSTLSELTLLATISTILVVVGSFMLHVGEGSTDGSFASFEGALWYSLFALISGQPVGAQPATDLDRLVTMGLILGGMTVFGMFVGTVSASMMSRLSKRMEQGEMDLDELVNHVVVCGWNRSGPTLVKELFSSKMPEERAVVIITADDELPGDTPTVGVRPELLYHFKGDFTRVEVLRAVGIERAGVAILLNDSSHNRSDQDQDARTVLAALTIERLAKEIFTCAQLHNPDNATVLRMAGVEEVVVGAWYQGAILGAVTRNRGLVGVLGELLSGHAGNTFYKVAVPANLVGQTVGALHALLKERYGAILLAVECQNAAQTHKSVLNPPVDMKVGEGDVLVVISERRLELG